jgi:hypothetical protein
LARLAALTAGLRGLGGSLHWSWEPREVVDVALLLAGVVNGCGDPHATQPGTSPPEGLGELLSTVGTELDLRLADPQSISRVPTLRLVAVLEACTTPPPWPTVHAQLAQFAPLAQLAPPPCGTREHRAALLARRKLGAAVHSLGAALDVPAAQETPGPGDRLLAAQLRASARPALVAELARRLAVVSARRGAAAGKAAHATLELQRALFVWVEIARFDAERGAAGAVDTAERLLSSHSASEGHAVFESVIGCVVQLLRSHGGLPAGVVLQLCSVLQRTLPRYAALGAHDLAAVGGLEAGVAAAAASAFARNSEAELEARCTAEARQVAHALGALAWVMRSKTVSIGAGAAAHATVMASKAAPLLRTFCSLCVTLGLRVGTVRALRGARPPPVGGLEALLGDSATASLRSCLQLLCAVGGRKPFAHLRDDAAQDGVCSALQQLLLFGLRRDAKAWAA